MTVYKPVPMDPKDLPQQRLYLVPDLGSAPKQSSTMASLAWRVFRAKFRAAQTRLRRSSGPGRRCTAALMPTTSAWTQTARAGCCGTAVVMTQVTTRAGNLYQPCLHLAPASANARRQSPCLSTSGAKKAQTSSLIIIIGSTARIFLAWVSWPRSRVECGNRDQGL